MCSLVLLLELSATGQAGSGTRESVERGCADASIVDAVSV